MAGAHVLEWIVCGFGTELYIQAVHIWWIVSYWRSHGLQVFSPVR